MSAWSLKLSLTPATPAMQVQVALESQMLFFLLLTLLTKWKVHNHIRLPEFNMCKTPIAKVLNAAALLLIFWIKLCYLHSYVSRRCSWSCALPSDWHPAVGSSDQSHHDRNHSLPEGMITDTGSSRVDCWKKIWISYTLTKLFKFLKSVHINTSFYIYI